MPIWLEAGLWGLLGGSSLVIGAAVAWFAKLPSRLTAGIMAFGCGILFSAVAFDLIHESFEKAGIWPVACGTIAGSILYTVANGIVERRGAMHRKRSGYRQTRASEGGAAAIAIGALLDGIPESIVLGVGFLEGSGVSTALFAAIFLSNLPEGLSSASGLKHAGYGARFIFGVWISIAVVSGVAALLGAALLADVSPATLATVNTLAAGALLTMIADTMLPEAVEVERGTTGLLVVLGFLVAFALR